MANSEVIGFTYGFPQNIGQIERLPGQCCCQLRDETVDFAIVENYLAPNYVVECCEKVFGVGIANIPSVGHEIVQAAIPFRDIATGSALDKDDRVKSNFE